MIVRARVVSLPSSSAMDDLTLQIRNARVNAVRLKNEGDRRGALDSLRHAKALEAQLQAMQTTVPTAAAVEATVAPVTTTTPIPAPLAVAAAAPAPSLGAAPAMAAAPPPAPAAPAREPQVADDTAHVPTAQAHASVLATAQGPVVPAAPATAVPAAVPAAVAAAARDDGGTAPRRRWSTYEDASGKPYFHDELTGETVWERPPDFDEEDAARRQAARTGMRPKKGKRGKGKGMWKRFEIATQGESESMGCYYVNTVTKVTQWDKPPGFEEEDLKRIGVGKALSAASGRAQSLGMGTLQQASVRGLAGGGAAQAAVAPASAGAGMGGAAARKADPTVGSIDGVTAELLQKFEAIGLMTDEATAERDCMFQGGADDTECCARLEELLALVQSEGEESEWDALCAHDNYRITRRLMEFWGPNSSGQMRLMACRLLVLFGKLKAASHKQLGPLSHAEMVAELLAGIDEVLSRPPADSLHGDPGVEDVNQDDLLLWCMMSQAFFTENADVPVSELRRLDDLAVVMFDIMGDATEDVFVAAARATFAINAHMLERGRNIVMRLVTGHKEAQTFGEAVMHCLNQLGYPYENASELKQILKVSRHIARWSGHLELCSLKFACASRSCFAFAGLP